MNIKEQDNEKLEAMSMSLLAMAVLQGNHKTVVNDEINTLLEKINHELGVD